MNEIQMQVPTERAAFSLQRVFLLPFSERRLLLMGLDLLAVNGALVLALAEAMLRFMRNPDLVALMGAASRQLAEKRFECAQCDQYVERCLEGVVALCRKQNAFPRRFVRYQPGSPPGMSSQY